VNCEGSHWTCWWNREILQQQCWRQLVHSGPRYKNLFIKFRFSKKATKILHLFWRYRVNAHEKWRIVTIFLAFLEYLNCRKLWLRSYKVEGQTWIVFLALRWRYCKSWEMQIYPWTKNHVNQELGVCFSRLIAMGTKCWMIDPNNFKCLLEVQHSMHTLMRWNEMNFNVIQKQ